MELKKNENRDVTKFRTLFRNVGLVITLLLTITAFEWKWEDVRINIPDHFIEVDTMIHLPNITHELPPVPELPKPESKVVLTSTIIELVDATKEIDKIVDTKPVEKDLTSLITSTETVEKVDVRIYEGVKVEEQAVPAMEYKAWFKEVGEYCSSNMKERDGMIKGKVHLSFVIEKDGSISNIKVLKGIYKRIDALAIRAVLNAGKWKPAKMGARPVRQKLILPISFK